MRLMPFISSVSAILLLAATTLAVASPTIEFEKSTYEAGNILAGEKIKATFPYKNTGSDALDITRVSASCGCTEAKTTATKLEPGQSAAIEAVFDSAGFQGKIQKSVYVATNDPAHTMVTLNITGEVVPIATLTPKNLNFGTLTTGATRDRTLIITPSKPSGFRILKVESSGKHVTVPEFKNSRDEKGVYTLKLVISAGNTSGRVLEQLKIITDLPGNPAISFTVYGNVEGDPSEHAKPS